MSQGSWGGGGGGGWGGGPPGGYGPPPGAPPGGYGPPGGHGPPGGGGYGQPPGGGGFGQPPGGGYGAPPGPPGGFAPPPMGYPPGYTPPAGGGVVAWEDASKGFFGKWWGTVKEVCFNPRGFFAGAAQSDNAWPSVTFAMATAGIVGLAMGLLIAVIYIGFGGLGMIMGLASGSKAGAGVGAGVLAAFGAAGIFAAILYPILFVIQALIAPWISGGIHHLILMLLGGATKSYGHTVRVSGYGFAAMFWVLVPLPCLNGLAVFIFSVIANIVGLDETHKCGIGKAVGAVLIPPALCACCYVVFLIITSLAR